MQQPPPLPLSTEQMADFDNFSDSDWHNVSSDRYSDISLSDHESDRDEISSIATRSRRSSVSEHSSLSSQVDVWEGVASDSEDAAELNDYSTLNLATDPHLAEEDERVKEALNQSFVGTLSNSRSSTTGAQSMHTSIRDLRLSFPDPLTSSRNELNRSYETISSPTESSHDSSDDISGPHQDHQGNTSVSIPPILTLQDPGLSFPTPAVQRHEAITQELEQSQNRAELDIILYGKSSEIKWKFVQDLIQKAASASGHLCLNNLRNDAEEKVQTLRLIKKSQHFAPFFNTINVYDRTDCAQNGFDLDSDSPSLAIVYLPIPKLPVLSWHSAYLPVVIPFSPLTTEAFGPMADDDWELLAVPADKTIKLGVSKTPVFDSDEVGLLNPDHAYEVLSDIGNDTRIELALKPLTEQVKSVNAVTLYVHSSARCILKILTLCLSSFAVMSIIMGFALNTAFRPSIPSPTPTVNMATSRGSLWGVLSPQANRSVVSYCKGSSANSGTSITSTSSAKDMALSVFIPGSSSLVLTGHAPTSIIPITSAKMSKEIAPIVNTSPAPKCSQCATLEPEAVKVSTEVSLRTPTSTSLSVIIDKTTIKPATLIASTSLTRPAEPTRAAEPPVASGSGTSGRSATPTVIQLPEVLDETVKTINDDINEIFDAADELLLSLRSQTDEVIRKSKGKARAFGEQMRNLNEGVVYRNSRAQARAKKLKEKGEKLLWSATQEFMDHTRRARKRAKKLKDEVLENANVGAEEAIRGYERAQEKWEGVLRGRDKSRCTTGKAERKERTCNKKSTASKENQPIPQGAGLHQKKAFKGGGQARPGYAN
ncbi:hypothetical protein BJ165DRAFT_1507346 [Panaeolus papilionaceus]|nr:hypothetical protein BJ165DRAFT_1507346 [Panaeolus papilionaceus]